MKLSVIFTILNQLKVDHWQTKSYAEHKALGQAYEEFDDVLDKFVEVYYGRYSIPEDNTLYNIKIDSYKIEPDLIKKYTQLREKVIDYLSTITSSAGDLKNIQDEIESVFDHLLYRLQQS